MRFRSRSGRVAGLLLLFVWAACKPLEFSPRDVYGGDGVSKEETARGATPSGQTSDPLTVSPGCTWRRLATGATSLQVDYDADGHATYAYLREGKVHVGRTRAESRDEVVPGISAEYIAALSIEPNGHPALMLVDLNQEIRIVRQRSHGWLTETLPDRGFGHSFEVDARGHGHLSFGTEDDSGLTQIYYATDTSGAWLVSHFAENVRSYFFEVDSEGFAHFVYNRGVRPRPSYATNRTGTWVHEHMSESESDVWAMRLNSQGNPVFLSQDPDGNSHKWVRTSSGWTAQPVEAEVNAGHLVLDSEDALHCLTTLYDVRPVAILYSRETEGSWDQETVAVLPEWPEYSVFSDHATLGLAPDGSRRVLIQHEYRFGPDTAQYVDEVLCRE